jgi:WD40 repeat protein
LRNAFTFQTQSERLRRARIWTSCVVSILGIAALILVWIVGSTSRQLNVATHDYNATRIAGEALSQQRADLQLLLAAEASELVDNLRTRSLLISLLERFRSLNSIAYPPTTHRDLMIGDCAGLSADCKTLIVGYEDGFALWDVDDEGLRWKRFQSIKGELWALAIDQAGTQVALCLKDNSGPRIKVCDLMGAQLHSIELTKKSLCSHLGFCDQGKSICAVDLLGNVFKWSVTDKSDSHQQPLDAEFFGAAARFSPDGDKVSVGSKKGTLLIWDTENWKELTRLKTTFGASFSEEIRAVKSPSASAFATVGYEDGTLGFWDLSRREEYRHCGADCSDVTSIDSSGDRLASACADGTLLYWTTDGARIPRLERTSPSRVKQVILTKSGSRALTVDDRGIVFDWDCQRESQIGRPILGQKQIVDLDVASQSDVLVACRQNGEVISWNRSGKGARTVGTLAAPPKMMAVDPEGSCVALVRNFVPIADVFNLPKSGEMNGTRQADTCKLSDGFDQILDVAVTSSLSLVAIRDDGNAIVIDRGLNEPENVSTECRPIPRKSRRDRGPSESIRGTRTISLVDNEERPKSAALSRNGKWCLAYYSNRFVVWDLQRGRSDSEIASEVSPDNRLKSRHEALAVSNAGSVVAMAAADFTVRICKLGALAPQFEVIGSDRPVVQESARSLEFSPDGKVLAVGKQNGGIVLWDVERLQTMATLLLPGGDETTRLRFGNAGDTLASVSSDFSTKGILWDLSVQQLRKKARHIANRPLTDSERLQFGLPKPETEPEK